MKTAIKNLLTDKSFWAAVIALVTAILVANNVPQGSIGEITAIIGAIGTFVAYIVGNSIQAAAQSKADAQVKTAQIALQSKSSAFRAGMGDAKEDK